MDIQRTPCSYHPQKAAIAICERCRRPICQEDRRIYRKSYTRSTRRHSHSFTTSYEYCILCNASQLETNIKWAPIGLIFYLPFLIIFLFIGITTFPPFVIIILFAGGILIYNLIQQQEKYKEARLEVATFRNNLNQINTDISPLHYSRQSHSKKIDDKTSFPLFSKKSKKAELYALVCFECGTELELNEVFCPNCGDNTQDELKRYYKLI
ncbi:MAG: zinc ribbon domain-containing protein [Candidatus Hodarchaeales archaeon]|jgi:hypothetical protein